MPKWLTRFGIFGSIAITLILLCILVLALSLGGAPNGWLFLLLMLVIACSFWGAGFFALRVLSLFCEGVETSAKAKWRWNHRALRRRLAALEVVVGGLLWQGSDLKLVDIVHLKTETANESPNELNTSGGEATAILKATFPKVALATDLVLLVPRLLDGFTADGGYRWYLICRSTNGRWAAIDKITLMQSQRPMLFPLHEQTAKQLLMHKITKYKRYFGNVERA